MANLTHTSNASLISTLVKSRTEIFVSAEATHEHELGHIELDRLHAIDSVIANTKATNKRDAAVQVGVALKNVESCLDGTARELALRTAYAALCSASAALGAPAF